MASTTQPVQESESTALAQGRLPARQRWLWRDGPLLSAPSLAKLGGTLLRLTGFLPTLGFGR